MSKNTLLFTCLFGTMGLLQLLQPKAALACSCMRSTPEEQLERADVVFTGRVIDKKIPTAEPNQFGGLTPIIWTFEVEDQQKGSVSAEQVVESASNSAACGINFTMGERYQVFANQNQTQLKASLCSGTKLLTDAGGDSIPEDSTTDDSKPEPHSSCSQDKPDAQ